MLAGIEEILAKIKRKEEPKAKRSKGTERNISPIDEESETSVGLAFATASKAKGSVTKDKPPRAGHNSSLDGLLSSDVFEHAAANSDKPALPVDKETLKSRAMTSLIASMPIEERRVAGNDKQRILKATRNLGFRAVTADGEGKWTLKGSLGEHTMGIP